MTKSRGAGRPRAVLAKASRLATAQARQQLGPLASLRVGPRTAARYRKALLIFFNWMRSEGLPLPTEVDDFDMVVCQFIETCWQEGEGRSRAADVICSLQWTSPLLKRHLNGSWSLLKAWQRTELPARAPPMPPKVVFALAEWLLRLGQTGMGLGIVLAAHCFLRTGELLSLGFGALSWADDFRSVIVSLGITKGGARRGAAESVKVELGWLGVALQAWAQSIPAWSARGQRAPAQVSRALRCRLSRHPLRGLGLRTLLAEARRRNRNVAPHRRPRACHAARALGAARHG